MLSGSEMVESMPSSRLSLILHSHLNSKERFINSVIISAVYYHLGFGLSHLSMTILLISRQQNVQTGYMVS